MLSIMLQVNVNITQASVSYKLLIKEKNEIMSYAVSVI